MKRRAAEAATPQRPQSNKHQKVQKVEKVVKPASPRDVKKAKKREDEDLKRKAAEKLALSRKEALEAVETARRQVEAINLAEQKRGREEGKAKTEAEQANLGHKRAEEAAAAAKKLADEAASAAKRLSEEAITAKRIAEEAALAAEVARKKAEDEEVVARRQIAEAESLKKDADESSAKLLVLSKAEEQAANARAAEKTATIERVLRFCSEFGLDAHEIDVNAIDVLWQHLVDVGAAADCKKENAEKRPSQDVEDTEMQATQDPSQQDESQTQATQETLGSQESQKKDETVKAEKKDMVSLDSTSATPSSQGAKSAVPGPPKSAPIVLHFLANGKFSVEKRIGDSAIAEATQQKLMQTIATKTEILEKKVAEAQEAIAQHAAAADRIGEQQRVAKVAEDEASEALEKTRKAVDAIDSEVSRVASMCECFAALLETADKANMEQASGYSKDLNFYGVAKDVVAALPDMFAKKTNSSKTKWGPKDKKVLSGIEEKLRTHSKARGTMLSKSRETKKEWEDKLAIMKSTREERARELNSFDEARRAKEAERIASEEDVTKAVKTLGEHENQMTREGFMRYSSSHQSCAICCDDFAVGQAVFLGCGHGWYCKECLVRFVDARLQEGSAGDIPCPSCKAPISEADLCKLLPKPLIFKLHASSVQQKEIRSGGIRRACPTPNCSMSKVLEDDSCGRQSCIMCNVESCWICGAQPYHEGVTCSQHAEKERALGQRTEDESFLEWMEATGTKQCPKCKMATSKENLDAQTNQDVECHKMMCRNCGTKFCFKCLALLTDTYTCGCTIDEHGFLDPTTGKYVKHLRGKPKTKAKPKGATWKVLN